MDRNGSGVGDIVKGALAGTAATWLVTQATTWLYEQEGEQTKARETEARGDRSAYEVAAEKAAGLAGTELSKEQRGTAGTAIHWATGIGAGIVYAQLRRRTPRAAAGKGLAFGAGFYLLVDELMNLLLGLTPGPQAFPWQAHARGLGGHLAFGVTAEFVLEGLDRVASGRSSPVSARYRRLERARDHPCDGHSARPRPRLRGDAKDARDADSNGDRRTDG